MHREIVHILVFLKADVLARAAPLFLRLAKVCPNTVLPIVKLQMALVEEHTIQCIEQGLEGVKITAAMCLTGATLRMVFSKYRQLAQNEFVRQRCLRKACCKSCKIVFMLNSFVSNPVHA